MIKYTLLICLWLSVGGCTSNTKAPNSFFTDSLRSAIQDILDNNRIYISAALPELYEKDTLSRDSAPNYNRKNYYIENWRICMDREKGVAVYELLRKGNELIIGYALQIEFRIVENHAVVEKWKIDETKGFLINKK